MVVNIQQQKKIFPEEQKIFFDIIYEDKYLLIINKPENLVMHHGHGNYTGTLLDILLEKYDFLKYIPRSGIVHRLDKNTSGLLIIAKTLESYFILKKDLKNRKITREYEAIVHGLIFFDNTIIEKINRHPVHRIKMCVSKQGRNAITHYKVIKRLKFYTHIKVILETGRTHQIRVHMDYIHHPIVGDSLYKGSNGIYKKIISKNSKKYNFYFYDFHRQALHAKKISLLHPISKNKMKWEISLPKDLMNLIYNLKKIN
ncbi:RluA family pseudouridine synthase [Buchnera aphidicola (Kurisakia onigurumii)]|uniref:RluA family pseudouridine synthase n=1 Tax=Buchnera aphidicola TaxID=9 RepID=UPI0031B71188